VASSMRQQRLRTRETYGGVEELGGWGVIAVRCGSLSVWGVVLNGGVAI